MKSITNTLTTVLRCALLFLLLSGGTRLAAAITLPDSLCVNGVPVYVEKTSQRIYASVIPEKDGNVVLRFTAPSGLDSLWVDGRKYLPGEPCTIKADLVRNAHTFRANKKTSSYSFLYLSLMPLVALTTSEELNKTDHKEGTFTLIDPLKRTDSVHTVFTHKAGLRIRGATSSSFDKKSYAIEMWDENNEEADTTVMGFRRDGDVVLDAAFVDHSRFRNRLLTDIWNAMDSIPYAAGDESKENGTVGQFVEVFLNGRYNGIYCLTDKIDRKKLHLKKLKEEIDGSITQRGLLWKAYSWTDATYLNGYDSRASVASLKWQGWEHKYPDDDVSQVYWQPLKSFIDWAGPARNKSAVLIDNDMEKHVYPQNVADYILLLHAFVITDNSIKNVYLSQRNTQKDQRVLFTPWDMDSSFGRTWSGAYRDEKGFSSNRLETCKFFYRLLVSEDHPTFKQLLRDTWDRLKRNLLSPDSVAARINAYRDLFYRSGAWMREQNRWDESMASSSPGKMCAINDEAKYMVNFYTANFEVVDAYLADFPSAIDEVRADAVPLSIDVTDGRLVVASPSAGEALVRVYDMSGVERMGSQVALPYTLEGLPQGIYAVMVKIGNTLVRKKIAIR